VSFSKLLTVSCRLSALFHSVNSSIYSS
jgi:hypothetical protein